MDPKQQLNQLDPKLQEAYNRVMGTTVSAPAAPTPAAPMPVTPVQDIPQSSPDQPVIPAPPPPPTPPTPEPVQETQPLAAEPPPPAPILIPQEDSLSSTISIAPTTPTGFVAQATNQQNKSVISPLILFITGVVFFIVYTLVWIKFFNLEIPFLPK